MTLTLLQRARLAWRAARMSTLENPSTTLEEFLLGGERANAGVQVTPNSALRLAAVFASVRVLAESIASLPVHVMERKGGGATKAESHPVNELLHEQPNDEMTSFIWRETGQGHLALRGNTYSVIERNGAGRAIALWPQPVGDVELFIDDSRRVKYRVRGDSGGAAIFDREEMIHIKGLGADGLRGYSVLNVARETIGLGLATQKHGAEFFGDGARPEGILSTEQNLTPEQRKRNRESWMAQHKNKRNMAVLGAGMKYQAIGVTPEEAQFLETRKFQVADVARIFRVPPHMIGDLEKATFSNIEHQALEFVVHTLRPWIVRWEQELNRKLFTRTERRRFFVAFNVDGLLRGDFKARTEGYASGITNGWMTRNEARQLENLNPAKGLDKFLVPMNMADETGTPTPPAARQEAA